MEEDDPGLSNLRVIDVLDVELVVVCVEHHVLLLPVEFGKPRILGDLQGLFFSDQTLSGATVVRPHLLSLSRHSKLHVLGKLILCFILHLKGFLRTLISVLILSFIFNWPL